MLNVSKEFLVEHYINQRMSMANIGKMFGVSGAGIRHWLVKYGIETRKPAHHMKCGKTWRTGKRHNEETKRKISEALTGRKASDDFRQKCSKRMMGSNNPMYGRKPKHPKIYWIKDINNQDICLRSSWEVAYVEWLNQHGYTWEYEPKTFQLDFGCYTPDFYVKDFNAYVEIKGWLHDRHIQKITKFRKLYPNISLIVINKTVMNFIGCDIKKRRISLNRPESKCILCLKPYIKGNKSQIYCSVKCCAVGNGVKRRKTNENL